MRRKKKEAARIQVNLRLPPELLQLVDKHIAGLRVSMGYHGSRNDWMQDVIQAQVAETAE